MIVNEFVTLPVSSTFDGWRIASDDRLDRLWLPLIGPTAAALIRLLDADITWAANHVGYGEPVRYRTVEVAARLGVDGQRAEHNLYRLRRFGLIEEDALETTYECPAFCVRPTVPPLSRGLWGKLPQEVRDLFVAQELTAGNELETFA